MIHSPELAELFTALAAFQSEVEAIPKDSQNPFFKSAYAALPDVVETASPLLTKNGLAVTQLLGHDERGDTLTTIVGHKSGQFIGDTMHLRPVKDDPQAQGSATTYGRRYAYMAALGLVADEDDDGNGASGKGRKAPQRAKSAPAKDNTLEPINGGQYNRLKEAFASAGQPYDRLFGEMDRLGVPAHADVEDVGKRAARRIGVLKSGQAEVLISALEGATA